MWANNETGVLFPVEKIAEIARRKRVLFHTDAIQAVGKIPIRLADMTLNSLALSAHKLHGPKGVGALYVNKRSAFKPLLIGGSQENNRRAGTENVASIVALGKAAECAAAALTEENSRVRAMRDRFESGLVERVPETFVNGDRVARLPNTSNLSFVGVDSNAALVMFDRHRLCCSAGSACRTGSLETSHVLRAMNIPPERAGASMRFSFGRFNTEGDVDKALEIIPATISKLRAMSPSGARREPASV
jgi:cysteine desulfurase